MCYLSGQFFPIFSRGELVSKGMNPKPPFTIGVDVGGTKIYSILCDSNSKVLARCKKKTGEGTPSVVLDKITKSVAELLEGASQTTSSVIGIGVGFPGPLDPNTGIVFEATNLPDWSYSPLADEIKQSTKILTYLDNDVNLGTLGEALAGAGKGSKNVVGIFLGTGVGGGIVLGGKLFHGTSGTAGEIGHMIIQAGGPMGPRKLKGSVEGLTSRTRVSSRITERILAGEKSCLAEIVNSKLRLRSSHIADAYEKRDPVVVDVLKEAARFVGIASGSLANLLAPDVIVLGGGLVQAVPDAIIERARKTAKKIVVPDAWKHLRIEPAQLGDDAGAVGGAILARQNASDNK